MVSVVGAREQQDERPDHTGQDRAKDDRRPEANTLPPAVILAVDIPLEHAHLLPDKGGAAKHGSPRRFNSPRKDIRWSALGLGSADNAHALARTFETAEDLADLLATMLVRTEEHTYQPKSLMRI